MAFTDEEIEQEAARIWAGRCVKDLKCDPKIIEIWSSRDADMKERYRGYARMSLAERAQPSTPSPDTTKYAAPCSSCGRLIFEEHDCPTDLADTVATPEGEESISDQLRWLVCRVPTDKSSYVRTRVNMISARIMILASHLRKIQGDEDALMAIYKRAAGGDGVASQDVQYLFQYIAPLLSKDK